ncbi:cell filamentation protein Fic [Bacillaceae bacterium SAS-127]|nr:cell filamentation protein Fic [Bacillaceae bacterium SAS-127]
MLKEEFICYEKQKHKSKWQIKSLHRLVLKGIDDEYAGVYRDQQVFIAGAKHTPPAYYLIKGQMESLMEWYEYLHPATRGAMLHAIFVGIHPIIDGNGRTSRLLLNLELMKGGFLLVIIKVENRLTYYEALDKAHTLEDYSDFIDLVNKEVHDSLDLYLGVLS